MDRRQFIQTAGAATLTGLTSPGLFAQKPVTRIIVPFAAGGPIDVTARVLAELVREELGGPVIVDNRPGGGGNIGMSAVARSAPDGLTLGIATTASHGINPWLFRSLPYDPVKDFEPVTLMLRVPNVLVMNAETADRLQIRTVNDLVRHVRANPGRLNYGSGGVGSAGHLAGELFKQKTGTFIVHIPYNGGNPAQVALVSGQVDFNFDNLATAAANIQAGRLRALAVTTVERSQLMPHIPTVAESIPGFEIDTWWGLVVPAGTPGDRIRQLNRVFTAALRSDEARTRFAALMAQPAPTTPEVFGEFLSSERAKFEQAVRISGATPS